MWLLILTYVIKKTISRYTNIGKTNTKRNTHINIKKDKNKINPSKRNRRIQSKRSNQIKEILPTLNVELKTATSFAFLINRTLELFTC